MYTINRPQILHTYNPKRLYGKVALILGASTGIGKECALYLARDGAKVVLVARRIELLELLAAEINAIAPNTAKYIVCNVLDIKQIEQVVLFAVKEFDKIDIAVNDFGICCHEDIRNLTEEAWDVHINTNAKGIAFAMKYEMLQMQKQESLSSIINIGSTLSLTGRQGLTSYCASKHAVIGLTKAAAAERVANIRINCVCPGWIVKDSVFEDASYGNLQKIAQTVEQSYPIGRVGMPQEPASLVAFLASDDSSFINASIITCDGGATCI